MNIERDIVPPLLALEEERSNLTSRLAAVEAACLQLRAVCAAYGHAPQAQPSTCLPPVEQHGALVVQSPRIVAELMEHEIAFLGPVVAPAPSVATAPVKAVAPAPVQSPSPSAPAILSTVPAVPLEGTSGPKDHGLTESEMRKLLSAWNPVVNRGNLSLTDIYQAFLRKSCRFSRDLPSEMDLSNPRILRSLPNPVKD